MKRLQHLIRCLTAIFLLLLAASGVSDLVYGLQVSDWYKHWYEEHYGPMPLSSLINGYALGMFRGAAALVCAAAGLILTVRAKVRFWYLLGLGICTSWYVRAFLHYAYRGVSSRRLLQMLAAALCLGMLLLNWYLDCRRTASQKPV